jgi:hypothetical protein
MFHVERNTLFSQDFWRAGASGKVKFLFDWCYLRQNTCKSDQCQVFFAGLGKIFYNCCSLCARPRAHPGSILANPGNVKNYLQQGPG